MANLGPISEIPVLAMQHIGESNINWTEQLPTVGRQAVF